MLSKLSRTQKGKYKIHIHSYVKLRLYMHVRTHPHPHMHTIKIEGGLLRRGRRAREGNGVEYD